MKKYLLAFMAAAVTSLTACGNDTVTESSESRELQVDVAEQELVTAPETTSGESDAPIEVEANGGDHSKLTVDKNTDLDLSKILIGDYEYDFGTLTVGELTEATGTTELGFSTLVTQVEDFNCNAYGFGKFSETKTFANGLESPDYGSYGTTYYLEYKLGDEWLPDLNYENIGDAEIVTFVSDDCGEDFDITFAGGLVWQEEMLLEDAKAVLGEGTAVGEHDFVAYCDGETMLVLGLDMFEDKVEHIYVYEK